MPKLENFTTSACIDDIVTAIVRDGAVILSNVLTPADLAQVNAELKPYVDATATGQDAFGGFKTTRTGAVMAAPRQPASLRSTLRCAPSPIACCSRIAIATTSTSRR